MREDLEAACPRWGSDPGASRYRQDWLTIAVPEVPAQQPLRPAYVTASSPVGRPARLTPFLGQVFVRTEPWARFARPWVDHIARCCFVLSRGPPAVDVAVFPGEEAPSPPCTVTVHGQRTTAPIPLVLTSSFDPDMVSRTARLAALEAASGGVSRAASRRRPSASPGTATPGAAGTTTAPACPSTSLASGTPVPGQRDPGQRMVRLLYRREPAGHL